MSDDLMTRLREEGLGFGIGPALLCQEAAATIERLTRERDEAVNTAQDQALKALNLHTELTKAREEIAALKSEVHP